MFNDAEHEFDANLFMEMHENLMQMTIKNLKTTEISKILKSSAPTGPSESSEPSTTLNIAAVLVKICIKVINNRFEISIMIKCTDLV